MHFVAREDAARGDRVLAHRAVLAGDHRRAHRRHAGKNYDFVTAETLAYFSARPPQARRDSDFALDYVKRNAETPEQQQPVLAALEFKCDVLWAMLDALHHAYVEPEAHLARRLRAEGLARVFEQYGFKRYTP